MSEQTDQLQTEVNSTEMPVEDLHAKKEYAFLKTVIDEVRFLDPDRAAQSEIFLQELNYKEKRTRLLNTLQIWQQLLETGLELPGMISHCEETIREKEQLNHKNMATLLSHTKELERSYRGVSAFFKNTESDFLNNISFINAGMEQLKDLDHTRFIDFVREELKRNYDRLDLKSNYSLLVIPGYLGDHKVVAIWAKIAHENKVMLVTDFEHLDEPDDVMELFERTGHTGGDAFLSNVMMTCNWLVARGRDTTVYEVEDLYMPPSSALAGKIYRTLMSQVSAGKRFGNLKEVNGVAFELKKSEIANIEKMGLIPMVKEQGAVVAFSAKTLFNGDNMGLQTYSVVRVFDYVTKVLIDFLNRRAFENFNANTRKELMAEMVKFLDSIAGPGRLVENFTIRRFEQDAIKKDSIHLDIFMKPYFPAKNFLIKMEGQKNEERNEWDTAYDDS